MTVTIKSETESRNFIAPQSPVTIPVQNGTVLDIGIEYGSMKGGRSSVVNNVVEVLVPPAANAAPDASEATSISGQANMQVVDAEGIRGAASAGGIPLPSFYAGRTLLISSVFLGTRIDSWYGMSLRKMIGRDYLFKKVKVSVYDPPVNAGLGAVPLGARRRTENYSFISPNGWTGLSKGAPNGRALSFWKYAESPITAFRATSISDRPSRFLLRGVTIPSETVFQNQNVSNLCTELGDAFEVPDVSNRTIRFVPKENVLNDLLGVRAVQCVGYTRVAGQKTAEENKALSEYGKDRLSGQTPPTAASAPSGKKAKPRTESPEEGGVE